MTAGFRVGHVTRSARHIFNHNLGRHRQTVRRPRNCSQMKKYLCRRTFAKGCRSGPCITPPRQVASEPSHPRATAAVSRVCRREKRSTAMPDTGSPPGPPELAGSQPWPGFDKFSAVQVGRPSRLPTTPSPRVSTAPEPNHEPSEGKPARSRGGGRPRASLTRALDPTKCPEKSPRALFPRFLISARSTLQLARADSPTPPFL